MWLVEEQIALLEGAAFKAYILYNIKFKKSSKKERG